MDTSGVEGDVVIDNIYDSIEALEAKVGANSSAVTATHDYKLSGVTGTDKAVSKTGTETLTNKTLTSPTITNKTSTGADTGTETLSNKTLTSPVITNKSSTGTDSGVETLNNKSFVDNTTYIVDDSDATKKIKFQASGITTGNTRTLTSPDANTTIVGTDVAQTLTNKTISTGSALDANAGDNFTYYGMARQAIINGNFDIWQRGTSFTNPGDTIYTADRFRVSIANTGTLPTTIIHSRQLLTSGDITNAYYHYRINTNGAGSGYGANDTYKILTRLENATRYLCGVDKKVTVSFWARSSIANKKIGIYLQQSYGTTGSPSSGENINGTNWTLTSTWTKYTYTFTTNTLVGKTFGTDNNDLIMLFFSIMWGTGTSSEVVGSTGVAETFVGSGDIDIAQVQLCAGDVALPFQPRSFGDELDSCRRYYEKSWGYATAVGASTAADICGSATPSTGALTMAVGVTYKTEKRVATTPTIYDAVGHSGKCDLSISDSWNTNQSYGGITSIGCNGFQLYASTANLNGIRFHYTDDAEI
jgi:hypothetical protein